MTMVSEVNFLLACIKHAKNGTIDFDALSTDVKSTKGAVQKRYSRLKKRAMTETFTDSAGGPGPVTPPANDDDSGDDNGGDADVDVVPETPSPSPVKPKTKRGRPRKDASATLASPAAGTKRKRASPKKMAADADAEDAAVASQTPVKKERAEGDDEGISVGGGDDVDAANAVPAGTETPVKNEPVEGGEGVAVKPDVGASFELADYDIDDDGAI